MNKKTQYIFALDIGTKAAGSGCVLMKTSATARKPVNRRNTSFSYPEISENWRIEHWIRDRKTLIDACTGRFPRLVFEGISSYGKAVGKETFGTVAWIGRLLAAQDMRQLSDPRPVVILRRVVKAHLVGARRPGDPSVDSMIATAIRERFGGAGATKSQVCGTKKKPGPLYGFHDDIWSAAAVGIAYVEGAETEKADWII